MVRCRISTTSATMAWTPIPDVASMDALSLSVGKLSGRFQHAEGWRRHLHLGFAATDTDPLAAALGRRYLVNRAYERSL